MPIAIPAMPTPAPAATAAGNTTALGRQVAEIVSNNLRNSGLFAPIGPEGVPGVAYGQVTSPDFTYWTGTGAQALVQGFVQALQRREAPYSGSVQYGQQHQRCGGQRAFAMAPKARPEPAGRARCRARAQRSTNSRRMPPRSI